jgi:hypothetical protein
MQNRGRWRTGWSRGSRGWTGFFLPRAAPTPGRTAAPAPFTVHAWHPRPAASPAGRAATGWLSGATASSFPGAASRFSSHPASPSPPLLLLLAVDREESPWAAAQYREEDGDFYRAALGFPGTEASGWDAAQGGTRPPSRAPALQGGGHGGRRGLRRLLPRAPTVSSRGRSQRGRG